MLLAVELFSTLNFLRFLEKRSIFAVLDRWDACHVADEQA